MITLDKRTTDYLAFVGPLNVWRQTMISMEAVQDYTAEFGSIGDNKLLMLIHYDISEEDVGILNCLFNFEFKKGETVLDANTFTPMAKYLMRVTMKGQS